MAGNRKEWFRRIKKFVSPYRITKGKKFRLKEVDPGDTGGLGSEQKPAAREFLAKGVQWLAEERCCWCSRRWTRPGRTPPSAT